ncbi:unnamed protein product, partial [Pylaiella littoralis]
MNCGRFTLASTECSVSHFCIVDECLHRILTQMLLMLICGDRGREGVLATTVVVVYSLFNRHSSPFDLEVAESTVHDDEGFVRTHQPVDCPSFYI